MPTSQPVLCTEYLNVPTWEPVSWSVPPECDRAYLDKPYPFRRFLSISRLAFKWHGIEFGINPHWPCQQRQYGRSEHFPAPKRHGTKLSMKNGTTSLLSTSEKTLTASVAAFFPSKEYPVRWVNIWVAWDTLNWNIFSRVHICTVNIKASDYSFMCDNNHACIYDMPTCFDLVWPSSGSSRTFI
jgi:hypothetical protein